MTATRSTTNSRFPRPRAVRRMRSLHSDATRTRQARRRTRQLRLARDTQPR